MDNRSTYWGGQRPNCFREDLKSSSTFNFDKQSQKTNILVFSTTVVSIETGTYGR